MQLLTTSGYKNIEDCSIGEQLIAYDIYDGHEIINDLLGKEWMSPDSFQDIYEDTIDESGNTISVLVKTKEEVYIETYGNISFYNINNTWILYGNQSIWANLNVVHAKDLKVGDTVYNGADGDVTIISIEEVVGVGWWRLSVSGDHSYIADNLTLHNASRYWVGGGSSSAWNAITPTNWGSTSGGANNVTAPTSADDVIFDGAGANGNTNSLISSSFTILSLNITLGYTSTMTHNTDLTIAGNITLTTGYTISGTSSLILTANSTINTNGRLWPNSFSIINNVTATLTSNLNIGGTLTVSPIGLTSINRTTSERLTVGGIFVTNAALSCTAEIYLTGGTWSANSVANPIGSTNGVFINGNVTLGTFAALQSSTLTLLSGTFSTAGSTFGLIGAITLTSSLSGITWNNITTTNNAVTMTLNHNLTLNGTLSSNVTTTLNRTTSEIITIGGLSTNVGVINGNADIYLTGGTWDSTVNGFVSNNLYLNGNITLGSVTNQYSNINGNLFTYQSGVISLIAGHRFTVLGAPTLNTFGMIFNDFIINTNSTTTLASDLTINGVLSNTTSNAGGINRTTNENIIVYGGLSMAATMVAGTADIYLKGGTWSTTGAFYVSNNLFLDGRITLGNNIYYRTGVLTYNSGIITSTNTILNLVNGNCTINNFNKVPLRQVLIASAVVVTMNEFFTGTPSQICQVNSAGANYTITFSDRFEKFAKNVAVLNATITNRLQLIVITRYKSSFNKGTNIGVRYINQSPNGFAQKESFIPASRDFIPMFKTVADPNFVKQA
jgi:hypothetical protein